MEKAFAENSRSTSLQRVAARRVVSLSSSYFLQEDFPTIIEDGKDTSIEPDLSLNIISRKGNSSFFIPKEEKNHIRLYFSFEKNVFLLPQKQIEIEIENRVSREINRDLIFFCQNGAALLVTVK